MAACFTLWATLAAAQKPNLELEVQPLFEGVESGSPFFPVRVRMANNGRDAEGTLQIGGGSGPVTIPVNLPAGSRKEVIANLHNGNWWEPTQVRLSTNRGFQFSNYQGGAGTYTGPEGTSLLVGTISDTPGLFGFVRGFQGMDSATAQDCTVSAADAPDRAVSYSFMDSLVLADGAERLSDKAVEAIQMWVMAGGQVVFLGGASSPVIRDPRWIPFLPVLDAQPRTISARSIDVELAGTVAVMSGRLAPGARARRRAGGEVILASRPMGMGETVFLAANPTEGVLSRWSGRTEYFGRILGRSESISLFDYGRSLDEISAGTPGQNDPFNVKLPDAMTIWGILLLYVLIVVPINLLTLRKLGKSEWAWFTTPVISLAFAGIFFQFAAGLYSAELSRATAGLLALDSRTGLGYWVGSSQIFFSRGGRYDLGFQGVEAVWSPEDYYDRSGMPGRSTLDAMGSLDVGEIVAPSMQATNLSFHEFVFSQRFEATGWFQVSKSKTGTITVRNNSPYALEKVWLVWKKKKIELANLAPGQSAEVSKPQWSGVPTWGPRPALSGDRPFISTADARNVVPALADLSERSLLVGTLKGLSPGPQIGKDVAARSEIRLVLNLGQGELD